jgi:hypothetical protein
VHVLKPQDLLVLLALTVPGVSDLTYRALGRKLGMPQSAVYEAVRRAKAVGLIRAVPHGRTPRRRALVELLTHGVRYVFVPERGGMARGIPTAHAAPILADALDSGDEPPPVWPHPEGTVRGLTFEPIYPGAAQAALDDRQLYDRLALLDALRAGRARERALAETLLRELLEA